MQPFQIVTPSKEGHKTVIVIGAFRGGTSMVAGVVDALGIPMVLGGKADNPGYPNYEDQEIQDILHSPDNGPDIGELLKCLCFPPAESESHDQPDKDERKRIMEFVADFQQRADRELPKFRHVVNKRNLVGNWGWKYPGTAIWLLKTNLLQQVRNPHIITIYRDPFAVWQSETKVNDKGEQWLQPDDFFANTKSFRYATVQMEMLVECVTKLGELKCPQLVVSYERATRDDPSKKSLAEGIRSFLQLPDKPERLEQAVQAMTRPSS